MTRATNLVFESSAPTRTYSDPYRFSGSMPVRPISAPDKIVSISDHPGFKPSSRTNGTNIDDFVAELERDEKLKLALEEGRRWVADTFYADDGDTIRTLRLRKGWSQSRLAEAARTSQSHVARIERGRENLSLRTMRRLCEALEVNMDAFDAALLHQEALVKARAKIGKKTKAKRHPGKSKCR
ncbi:MAG: helix-turn-helix transcriptional regulator [Candidatus Competibacteraceae bacterium]|nr:helix-turn-helix transcriptional regulator [Candidatus Competibacteraceae bacterium]